MHTLLIALIYKRKPWSKRRDHNANGVTRHRVRTGDALAQSHSQHVSTKPLQTSTPQCLYQTPAHGSDQPSAYTAQSQTQHGNTHTRTEWSGARSAYERSALRTTFPDPSRAFTVHCSLAAVHSPLFLFLVGIHNPAHVQKTRPIQ